MSVFAALAKILFIGHSLIGPDLPEMVQAGLRQMGQPADVAAQVINGAPLRFNFEHGGEGGALDAKAELAKGETEVLILTEAIPLAQQLQWNDTPGQIAAYADLAARANPDVRVFLYETWHSRKSGPGTVIEGDPDATIPWRDRLDQDLPLWEGAAREASAQGVAVTLIPAGQAMARLSDAVAAQQVPDVSSMDAFFEDDIHLSSKGLYYVAMVHLAAITGKSPEGLPAKLTRSWKSRDAVISDRLARVLQRLAWETLRDYRPAEPAPLVAKPAGFTPITNPNLALGLNGVADWTVEQPFLNIMKTAREWTGHLPGQWGGWDHAKLAAAGYLDENGWLKSIPPELSGVSTLFLTDLPPDAGGVAGRYLLTYQGKGTLRVEGRAQHVASVPGQVGFDFTPGEGGVIVTLEALDRTDPIRDIVVVREDRAALLAQGQVFNPDWLARLRGVKMLRFMDWMKTNNSPLARLEDRPKPADYTWSRIGVPVEVMVQAANELGADAWFTMPHLSEDALVQFYAQTVRDGLKPGLLAYAEYSNEVWNWQFEQAAWAEAQGKARWGKDSTWVQFYALRAAQVADIWASVYGDQARARLVRVISTQTGYLGLEDQILAAPNVLAEGKPAPAKAFDAYAVTGYFSAELGDEKKLAVVRDWLAQSADAAQKAASDQGLGEAEQPAYLATHRFDLAVTLAAQELANGAMTGQAEGSVADLIDRQLAYHAKVAAKNGLRLVMYEGGSHVVGLGLAVDDPELTAFFTHFNYTPEMAALYQQVLQGWAALTPEPFNAFVDISNPGKWGSWGALRHLGDENPRWAVLAKGCATC
jgi:hypothetical protein